MIININFKTLKNFLVVLIPILFLTFSFSAISNSIQESSIYWSDGDSGKIDGVKFRLANIDAPESGRLGQRSGAKCPEEVELGKQAKEFVTSLTNNADINISKNYGEDRYGRLVVDLNVNGKDIAVIGLRRGFFRSWKHENGRSIERKPLWCNLN
ncbi:MAG: thermonuclease family protein [Hellea sp.]